MGKNTRQLIKEINRGKNLDINLPYYMEVLTEHYYGISLLNFAMDYATFYEMTAEADQKEREAFQDTIDRIQEVIQKTILSPFSKEETNQAIDRLERERNQIIEKMKFLTRYTDKMLLYEYVLNRMEHRYDAEFDCEDETQFAERLLAYIFQSKDNMVINERIQEVLGQLPVRMARSRYFDLIKNSLSVYQGSDKSALDAFVYMLKSSASLYKPEREEPYFPEFKRFAEELEQTAYDTLEEEAYHKAVEKLHDYAERMTRVSDFYVSLQRILNYLYTLLLAMPDQTKKETKKEQSASFEIIRELYEWFRQGMEEKCYSSLPIELEERFFVTEGILEERCQEKEWLESILEEVISHQKTSEEAKRLKRMSQLMSSSLFIEWGKEEEKTAEEAYVSKVTKELLGDFSDFFHNHPVYINRAVIANTINKIPIFFQTANEVSEYIQAALAQCRDQGEKAVSMELINRIMEEA